MSYHARTILPSGASRKRKERESYYPFKLSASIQIQPSKPTSKAEFPEEAVWSNRLLAGYMAHEFLTKGTLLGQKFDPARSEAVPVGSEWKREKEIGSMNEHKSYAEVASILKSNGTQIPGIVNPTQLARWIQM